MSKLTALEELLEFAAKSERLAKPAEEAVQLTTLARQFKAIKPQWAEALVMKAEAQASAFERLVAAEVRAGKLKAEEAERLLAAFRNATRIGARAVTGPTVSAIKTAAQAIAELAQVTARDFAQGVKGAARVSEIAALLRKALAPKVNPLHWDRLLELLTDEDWRKFTAKAYELGRKLAAIGKPTTRQVGGFTSELKGLVQELITARLREWAEAIEEANRRLLSMPGHGGWEILHSTELEALDLAGKDWKKFADKGVFAVRTAEVTLQDGSKGKVRLAFPLTLWEDKNERVVAEVVEQIARQDKRLAHSVVKIGGEVYFVPEKLLASVPSAARYAAAPRMIGKTAAARLIKLNIKPKSVITPVPSNVLAEICREAVTLFAW
jgi:hypothetical protein